MRDVFQSFTSLWKWTKSHSIITEWDIDWDRVTADEMHTEVSITVITVHLFINFNSFCKIRKWFLTDTLFEFFSAQIILWINIIQQLYWTHSALSFQITWSEKYQHQMKLKHCTTENLYTMRKIYTHIVNEKITDSHKKLNYLKILMTVLRTL